MDNTPNQVQAARSSFVTALAWVFIGLSGFATLIAIAQNVMINTIFPVDQMEVAMHSAKTQQDIPPIVEFMSSHFRFFFGAFLGILTLLDEGAELAMGIHCANNLVSSLLITSRNSVLQTDAIFYTTSENPGGEFIMWIAMATICFFILHKKYTLSNWKLILR